jgi:hypothetical protein
LKTEKGKVWSKLLFSLISSIFDRQGIPKTVRELKAEKGKVWSKLFFATLFLSLIFNAIDTGKISLKFLNFKFETSYIID